MNSVVKYLEIANDSSPVWLDGGNKIAYIHHDEAGDHIWDLDLTTGERRRWTQDPIACWQLYADQVSGSLYFSMDPSGSECESIFRLTQPGAQPEKLVEGGPARNFFAGVHPGAQHLAYASNQRHTEHFDIWIKDLETGQARLVQAFEDNYNWPAPNAISPNGRYFLYNKLKAESDNALWMTDLQTGDSHRVLPTDQLSADVKPCWKHDSRGFYFLSELNAEFYQLYYYDLDSKEASLRKAFDYDIENLALSADDRYLCLTLNASGYSSLKIYDLTTGQAVNTILPPKAVISPYSLMTWSQEGHKLLFSLSSGARPEGIWLLDLDRDAMQRLSPDSLAPDFKASLVEPELRSYQSFDGLKVDYWLYLPQGQAPRQASQADQLGEAAQAKQASHPDQLGEAAQAKQDSQPDQIGEPRQLPCLIEIHGGPEGQERPSFNEFIQYLLAQGIAVVAPNVRGSTGYGKHFTHLDDVEKRLDSVRDIEALVHHLVDTGLADKDRIGVSGTSYGGFMTLSCAGRLPDLFACAVDTVGMYNLVTFLENTADYRRPHRESEYGSLAQHRELLYEVSPIAKIDNITAPLMVIQGKNDPRVPVTESDQVVDHLKSLGKEVFYLCYPDEGHGIRKMKNRVDCYPKIADFLKTHLAIQE